MAECLPGHSVGRPELSMAHSSWLLWLFLCCVAGQATPGEQRESIAEALGYWRTRPRPNLQDQLVALGQRAVLWLVSTVGLYGLTSLLDDFPDKQKNEEVGSPGYCHPPHRGSSRDLSLKCLDQAQQDLVKLLVELWRCRDALGWLPEGRHGKKLWDGYPSKREMVIYEVAECSD